MYNLLYATRVVACCIDWLELLVGQVYCIATMVEATRMMVHDEARDVAV